MHAVFATTYSHKRLRVSDPLPWAEAQAEWNRLDGGRLAGVMPHVKFFEVRSMDDPGYKDAPLSLTHRVQVGLDSTRGHADRVDAAKKAWKLFAPTFRSRWDKSGSDKQARTGVQGTGGWYYWPNGGTAAQGKRDLAALCIRRGLIVQGKDNRWYVLKLDEEDVAVAA